MEQTFYDPGKFLDWLHDYIAPSAEEKVSDSYIARHVGTGPATIHRWRKGAAPSPELLRRISEWLSIPIKLLYVRAGYLSVEEAEMHDFSRSLDSYPNDVIAEEVLKRMNADGK